jgi:zinc transport system substrate-binding protein
VKRSNLAIIGGIAAIAVGLALVQITPFDTSDRPNITDQTVGQEPAIPKLKVIASFYPLYEFSKNVGGDKAEVSSLIPIGVEPHDWEPSTGDILDLKEANLFVYNGGGFEPFVDQLINSGEYDGVMFVESTKGLELIKSQHTMNLLKKDTMYMIPSMIRTFG